MKRQPKPIGTFIDDTGTEHVVHRHRTGRLVIKRPVAQVHEISQAVATVIGYRVRALRLERGWTMGELARKAGLSNSKQRIQEIELATSGGLKLGTLYMLAKALEIDPVALLPTLSEVFYPDELIGTNGFESKS